MALNSDDSHRDVNLAGINVDGYMHQSSAILVNEDVMILPLACLLLTLTTVRFRV